MNILKRVMSLVLVAVIALSAVSCAKSDDGTMNLDKTAFDYAREMGIGINIGNTFDGFYSNLGNKTSGCSVIGENTPLDYEKCWGAIETTQEIIDGIRDAGFKTVRIPVYWGNMMEDDDTYTINEDFLARVKEVVDYCRNDDLYVVVNMHHYDEYLIKNKPRDELIKAVDIIWTQIANAFIDYSDYLVFEGFNENVGSKREEDNFTDDEIYDYVNEINQTFVDAVRKTGGNNANRLLIISGYHTNIDRTTDARFLMPTDTVADRMMVSVHYIDNACYWENRIGGGYWEYYSKSQCELLKEAFIDKGIPVFVGEFSTGYPPENFDKNAIHTTEEACVEYLLDMSIGYGFTPVFWDTCNDYYSRTNCEIVKPEDQDVVNRINDKYFADLFAEAEE